MSAGRWIIGALGLLWIRSVMSWSYPTDVNRPYGPKWGPRLPPGLPPSVRHASMPGAAADLVRRAAAAQNLGSEFVAAILELAQGESNATVALPANNYNAMPRPARGDASLITAWGTFQWNAPAGRGAAHMADIGIPGVSLPPGWLPWDWSTRDEIEQPISMYAQIWRWVLEHGGDWLDAARGVRLWHTGSAWGESYLRAGAARGFRKAWTTAAHWPTDRIDAHLRAAGLI